MLMKHCGVLGIYSLDGYNVSSMLPNGLDVDGLSRGIGLPKYELCLSYTTGDYSCSKYIPRFKTREEMKA